LVPILLTAGAQAFERSSQMTPDGIAISTEMQSILLADGQTLRGAIVDSAGQPVVNVPVVIAQCGKVLHQTQTDEEGRFVATKLSPGVYQVASPVKAQNYTLVNASVNQGTKQGIVHVMDDQLLRANECQPCQSSCQPCRRRCPPQSRRRLCSAVSHPSLLVGMLMGGAIVGLAGLDDEAS
jgi:hypothetical protein